MNEQEFKNTIYKFREEDTSILNFQPRIEYLIDDAYCQTITKELDKPDVAWERMNAVDTLGQILPNDHGLYMFVWRPHLTLKFASHPHTERFCWVLYIGKAGIEDSNTSTIKERYTGEYSKFVGKDASCLWDSNAVEKREAMLARYLTLRPLEFWYLSLEDVSEIMRLEKQLIRTLQPPLNQQYGPKARLGKSSPAF